MMAGRRHCIAIVAGGTGGHLYPGIALARAWRDRFSDWDSIFIVRRGDLGKEALQKEGFGVEEIAGQGLPRRLSLKAFAFPYQLARSSWEAWALLRRRRPEAVVGMGGYLSFPLLVAAHRLGVPTFIHEQNVVPGLANRLLGRWVDAVAVSFEPSRNYFKARQLWTTGLPVRAEIGHRDRHAARQSFGLNPEKVTFLIFGGSQGAFRMNQLVLDTWRSLSELASQFQVLHIAGPKHAAEIETAYRKLPIQTSVLAYCHDMPAAYAAADLVICRAGASTVAELLVASRPAILVPFPYASDNHQLANARVLEGAGLAEIVEEKAWDVSALACRLQEWIRHPERLRQWQDRFSASPLAGGPREAAGRLAELVARQVTIMGAS